MSEYTTEEHQELIEDIKNPVRYYRLTLWGYGGESAYIELNKEQYEFWETVVNEHGDYDLVNYMINAEDGDFDFEDIASVPESAEFMKDEEGDPYPWYDAPTVCSHQYGVAYDSARITLTEVDSEEYNADVVGNEDIVAGEELEEFVQQIEHDSNYEIELTEMGVEEEDQPSYVCQFYSAEKGTFFETVFATTGRFDPRKLKIYTSEFWNGEDIVTSMEYNGEDLENMGGDTNGKGCSAHLWKNV